MQLKKPLFLHERAAFVDFLKVRASPQQPLQHSSGLMYIGICRLEVGIDSTRLGLETGPVDPISLGKTH